jgi:hypothetical protein
VEFFTQWAPLNIYYQGELPMSYMNPIAGFEPGPTTRYLLLFVRKEEKEIGQTKFPGLFQDKHFDIMMSFFIIALVLECVGLWFIIDEIGLGFWRGLMSIAFLVLLDLLFAFLYHLKTRPICLRENLNITLSLTADSGTAAKIKKNKDEIFWAKFWSYFAAMAIWGLAALKTVSFLALQSVGGGGIDTKTLFILVTYVIVALIHVHFTGYALFGLAARFRWRRDERTYVHRGQPERFKAKPKRENIITSIPIPQHTTAGNHVLEKLLSVDLIFRDEQGKARVVLEPSLKNELEAKIRSNIEQEYVQQRGVPKIDLPSHQAEINDKVHHEIDEMIKVDINPETTHGILRLQLANFLGATLAISQANINALAQGQALYRLKSVGLLLDDELEALTSDADEPEGKNKIALHGLHLQLQMI